MEEKLLNKTNEINEYYSKMKLVEKKTKIVKEKIEEICEMRMIEREELEGYIIRKNFREPYTWKRDVYNILKREGKLGECLRHGNEMKERFDLSPYIKPKTEDDLYVKITKAKRSKDEVEEEMKELENFSESLKNKELKELIQNYAQQKKIFDIHSQRYEYDKEELKKTMLEAGLFAVENFRMYEKADEYDFEKIPAKMTERVIIATNDFQSVDLIKFAQTAGDKLDKTEILAITPDELDNAVEIKRRFGKKKLDFLKEKLGEGFYFVEGTRIEEDVHSRFPVNNSKIDYLIKKEKLPEREIMRQRRVDHEKKPIEFYEIISVENDEERKRSFKISS